MQPGVLIYTSNRLEDLLTVLAERLAVDPLPPLETETIVVPGQGMARWLRFELAARHGIAAGLALPFPGAFLQQLNRRASAATGNEFGLDVLTWRVHRLLGDTALQRELGPATSYCSHDPDGRKRFQLSKRIAGCFDDYQLYRDDLLARAANGDDLRELGDHGPWQAKLWRALLRDAGYDGAPGAAAAAAAPMLFAELEAESKRAREPWQAHRLQSLERLLADPGRARAVLPPRLSVFAASTLPPALLRLLFAVSRQVEVALYVPTPSPHWFGDQRKGADGNALLARLGIEAREFQDALVDLQETSRDVAIERRDLGELDEAEPPDLLACLQQDLAWVRERGTAGEPPAFRIAADDDSLRVHDCHSEHRELEVVRDQILAAFATDPELQPHDVLVLVPDIERYSPYVHAVFGAVQEHLPYQVADKSPVAELPICAGLFRLLRLADTRIHVHDVLHLLETPAMQRRFDLFASDLPILSHLCERAGIRWGLDGDSRHRRFDVPAFDDNSWRLGIERMLLGVASGPVEDLVLGRLPVADVTAGREALLERFLAFLDALFGALRPLQRPHSLARWADLIDALVSELFAADADDAAGVTALTAATAGMRAAAEQARAVEPITPIVLQDWLQSSLGRAANSQGFLGGRVTVAAMLPMRAVPVRRLFLCGLDDRSFPRRDQPASFDLTARPRRAGDRSPRLDDRQLFLDCLLAARQQLHITFVGHSQKDDSECAPSVVLAELLETVERCCLPAEGRGTAREQVVVRHPLQAWSGRYRSGSDTRLFTYGNDASPPDEAALIADRPWFAAPITPLESIAVDAIAFDTLSEFWWHPCRFFLRHCLGVRLPRDSDDDLRTESFAVTGLDHWRLLDAAVRRTLAEKPQPLDPMAHARAGGLLPAGGSGISAFAQIHEEVLQFTGELQRRGSLDRRQITATGADFTVTGELQQIGADELVYARPAKIKPKDRLRAWLWHVTAATARVQGADLPPTTTVIARDATLRYRELQPDEALAFLTDLVTGFRNGITAPLPFFEASSHEYGHALHKKAKATAAALRNARRKWLPDTSEYAGSDSEDHSIALCMRGQNALELPDFTAWAARIWRVVYGYTEARR